MIELLKSIAADNPTILLRIAIIDLTYIIANGVYCSVEVRGSSTDCDQTATSNSSLMTRFVVHPDDYGDLDKYSECLVTASRRQFSMRS